MADLINLLEDKVSNIDSDLMQGASLNEVFDENQTNTFESSEKNLYKLQNNELLVGNDNFKLDKSYPPEGSLPKSVDTNTYQQNLEHLIQQSVAKSTARLLTKNTLKYLDKGLMVTAGEGVSKQFTVRSAKPRDNFNKSSRKEEGYDIPVKNPGNKSLYETSRSIFIDPKISSFRLHKVTYEMFKLFENMKSFDSVSKANTAPKTNTKEAEPQQVAANYNEPPSLRKLSIVSSNFDQVENTSTLFESRLKPKPYPSVSTFYPEDSNKLTYTSSNRFGNISSNFTVNSELIEASDNGPNDFKDKIEHRFLEESSDYNDNTMNPETGFDLNNPNAASFNADNYEMNGHKIYSYPMEDKTYGYPSDFGTYNYKFSPFVPNEFEKANFTTSAYASGYEPSKFPSENNETVDNSDDLEVYKIDIDFKKKEDMEPFATAVSGNRNQFDSEAVKTNSFNKSGCYNPNVSVGKEQNDDSGCGNSGNNEKPADESKKTNRQNFNSSYVTKVYVPLERIPFMPKRRAVIVGCNYLGNANAQLRGSCNDAFAFAHVLVTKFNFAPSDVILLLDSRPSPAYTRYLSQFTQNNPFQPNQDNMGFNLDLSKVKSNIIERTVYPTKKTSMFGRHLVERDMKHLSLSENLYVDSSVIPAPSEMQPTRANVFRSLKWLNFVSSPNDFAVFYFSGQSVQVDDLSGYEGDGFDEALVPSDYERNGLVTCNDLKCLFQSIGATCRLNVFLDTCNMQTVVGGSSRAGPVEGSKMKGFWPFSEPTGKLNTFKCGDWVDKDQKMLNQMTRVKFIPTLQVDSLSSLSDVQLSLDATHGVVNYFVLSSSNLNAVSLECLFKPLNLGQVCKETEKWNLINNWSFGSNPLKQEPSNGAGEDEVIVHGAFTYTLLLTLLYDKSSRRGGLGVDEVVEGVNKKLSHLKKIRLPKLNQQCEALFYHSSKLPKNAFLFPPTFTKYTNPKKTDSAYGFYLPQDAWMFMVEQGRQRAREHQQKFERMKTDLITLTNLNNKLFNQSMGATKLNTTRTDKQSKLDPNTGRTNNVTHPNLTHNMMGGHGVAAMNPHSHRFTYFPNAAEVPENVMYNKLFVSGRSLTNNVNPRIFTRTSSLPGKVTGRSKTATLNNNASLASGMNYGFKQANFMNVIPSHNWYGGCTVSVPFNKVVTEENYQSQPTWFTDVPDSFNFNKNVYNDQPNYDPLYYGKFGAMPMYEPITATLLQNLPTRKSFTVLQQ